MRKPVTRVLSRIPNDDRLKILIKRMLTYEEAIDYLISAISYTQLDDMQGELEIWSNRMAEFKERRDIYNQIYANDWEEDNGQT